MPFLKADRSLAGKSEFAMNSARPRRWKRFRPKAFQTESVSDQKRFQWNGMNCEHGSISFGSPINAAWIQRILAGYGRVSYPPEL